MRGRGAIVLLVAAVAVLAPAAEAFAASRENVAFWYQDEERRELWGEASRVVSVETDPGLIHANGSEAWKYGQISWFPDARPTWNGATAAQRIPWRLCRRGATNGVGDLTRHPPDLWYWADYNERAYSDAMVAWAHSVKAEGWDGLFFDTAGITFNGPERDTVSTCTSDPLQPGLRQRDAYVNLARRIHRETGLGIALNNPPADIIEKHLGTWLAWYMRENMGVKKTPPQVTFVQALYDSKLPFGRVVEMGKSLLPPGTPGKGAEETYAWARAKLAGQPVAVNTGYDRCPNGAPLNYCLRMGIPTDLINLRLGPAIGSIFLQDCTSGTFRCVMGRRFRDGMVLVNTGGRTRRADVANAVCHRMVRVRTGWLHGTRCSKRLVANIGAHRAWIVTYR